MLILPTVIIALSGISGAGGIALSAKSMVDSFNASATTRYVQEQNEKNVLRFQACSEKLNDSLEDLGKQRMIITKNFSVFVNAFEKIHNRPNFTTSESVQLPEFDFEEIKNVSIVAEAVLGSTLGAIGGSVLAAASTSGTTAAVMALGTASTGTKIAELSGAAATKAALAALGGGSIAAGGGGIALGTLVLNVASLGVGVLIEGIAMAFVGSVAKKQADRAKNQLAENTEVLTKAIDMQLTIGSSVREMKKVSVEVCNGIYKELVLKLKNLVEIKNDWNDYSEEEKALVENNILAVQILHYLNNTPLYKVSKVNEAGEIEEVEPNSDEIKSAVKKANEYQQKRGN